MTPALRIEGYDLAYRTRAGPRPALAGIGIAVAPGEPLGLVGASGSGRTSLARSIPRMLPANARENGGTIQLAGEDLLAKTRRQLAALRAKAPVACRYISHDLALVARVADRVAVRRSVPMLSRGCGRRADGRRRRARWPVATGAAILVGCRRQDQGLSIFRLTKA